MVALDGGQTYHKGCNILSRKLRANAVLFHCQPVASANQYGNVSDKMTSALQPVNEYHLQVEQITPCSVHIDAVRRALDRSLT
jgi:hypothetical protein